MKKIISLSLSLLVVFIGYSQQNISGLGSITELSGVSSSNCATAECSFSTQTSRMEFIIQMPANTFISSLVFTSTETCDYIYCDYGFDEFELDEDPTTGEVFGTINIGAPVSQLYFESDWYQEGEMNIQIYGEIPNVMNEIVLTQQIRHDNDANTAIKFPSDDNIHLITNGISRLSITENGYVGIGRAVSNPGAQLVVGSLKGASVSGSVAGNAVFGSNIAINEGGSDHNKLFTSYTQSQNWGYAGIHVKQGTLNFYASSGHTTQGSIITPVSRMFINHLGDVGIGTVDPRSRLSVEGQIRATEVKILADISVPDYVFESSYCLPTLQEVKSYVLVNKHLPEIPSAAEIDKNGIDLGDMNMRLLKKVEELTLYQIELMEELESIKKELDNLKN